VKKARSKQPIPPHIVEAATNLFYTQGYAETSMQDIADEVDLLKGSLYHYIESKEDLLFRIIEDVRRGSLALIDEVRERVDLRAIERLHLYVARNVTYHGHQRMQGAILHRYVGSLRADRQATFRSHVKIYEEFVASIISSAKAEGDISDAFSTRLLTEYVFAVINSVFDWYKPTGPITPEELGDAYAALAISGVTVSQVNSVGAVPTSKR
jgi:AcrR family transcriptional regulator